MAVEANRCVLVPDDNISALVRIDPLTYDPMNPGDNQAIVSQFGEEASPEEPGATIRVDADVYRKLRSGEISAPSAFMEGKIHVDGDLQLAMQLALSAVAPD